MKGQSSRSEQVTKIMIAVLLLINYMSTHKHYMHFARFLFYFALTLQDDIIFVIVMTSNDVN